MGKQKSNKIVVPSQVRKFDPASPALGLLVLGFIAWQLSHGASLRSFLDWPSAVLIFGGLLFTVLWQFGLATAWISFTVVMRTLRPSTMRPLKHALSSLDRAIVDRIPVADLAEGRVLRGELLNDAVYLLSKGLLKDELEQFLCLRLEKIQSETIRSCQMLQKMTNIAPSLGLLGTVIGLINLLQTMSDPTQLGSAMSLALLTTAYGSGVSTFALAPLAGRVQQQLQEEILYHQEFLHKFMILVAREEGIIVEGKIGRVA